MEKRKSLKSDNKKPWVKSSMKKSAMKEKTNNCYKSVKVFSKS